MERELQRESDFKSLLVSETVSISLTPVSACVHRRAPQLPARSSFVDWYRVLRVEEDAGIGVIRKQYHKLALQLHPDKNTHPKAEVAFKLVLEAYKCLSDDERRTAFNLERWENFCIQCNRIPYATSCNFPTNFRASKPKSMNLPTKPRSCKVLLEGLKDMRIRFKEEARVIRNCLKANNTLSRKESPLFNPSHTALHSENRKESPVFDPSDYVFDGYPHIRNQMYKKPENLWYLQRANVMSHGHGQGKVGMDDIPVFRTRTDWTMFKSKSTCVRS